MDFSFCRPLFFPCFSPLFARGKLHQICLPLRGEGGGERRRMRCSAAARLCRQMLHFASLTEILSLRYRLSVFLSRRKKNSEKERPLRGFRREVRFIMSPPGKRRHNELNAAPPPETPRRTGKPGETNNRDVMHSGKSCRVRAKPALHYFFFPSTLLCFFLSKKEDVPLPIFSPPRRLHCPRPATA